MNQRYRRHRPSRPVLLVESVRDQVESEFTRLLRELWLVEPALLAAVLVDNFGECVDYCATIDPFEAKVIGAHLGVVMAEAQGFAQKMRLGRVHCLEIAGAERDFVGRSVGEGYLLVAAVQAGHTSQQLLDAMVEVSQGLRKEGGIEAPSWDPGEPDLRVLTREAVGWAFAPEAIVSGDKRSEIVAVLGRWEEDGGLAGGKLVCFRVRVKGGTEQTIAFDAVLKRWMAW